MINMLLLVKDRHVGFVLARFGERKCFGNCIRG